jgi:hypothetical protein
MFMKEEKQKEPDELEKEMKRLIRKLDGENDALNKILKNTVPVKTEKQPEPGRQENAEKK